MLTLYRNIAADGQNQYFWWCLNCDRRAAGNAGLNIPHDVIRLWYSKGKITTDLDEVPVLNDYSEGVVCDVCGGSGAQYHHFAPQALADLFGENWSQWPTADLCTTCHKLWHSVVTFYMPGPAAPNPEMVARYGARNVFSR